MRPHLPILLTALTIACGGTEPTRPPEGSAADTLFAVTGWLATASSAIPAAAPAAGDAELPAVRSAASGALVIGLGEATHGTREFELVKHRILQTLVREGNVSAFLLEANLPAARDLDRYVRDGVGDPAVLLSRMYATAWNTQEMLDLIRWLRAYNGTQPADRRVGFGGVDPSFSSAAIDSVRQYANRVDATGLGTLVNAAYACFDPYNNTGGAGSLPR